MVSNFVQIMHSTDSGTWYNEQSVTMQIDPYDPDGSTIVSYEGLIATKQAPLGLLYRCHCDELAATTANWSG